MRFLRKALDDQAKHFLPGGKLHKFYPLYEAQDTFLFTPGRVSRSGSHVRDAVDMKRMMMTVVVALIPCVLMALYNTGYQANRVIAGGGKPLPGWRTGLIETLGVGYDPASCLANCLHGAVYFLPLLIVGFAVGGAFEALFSCIRRHEVNEGFLVTGMLYPLILPATLPLWQAAIGIIFAIVIGKEIFGGTGMNVLNPALTARAFLFFAYPAQISGDIWVAATTPDGVSSATWLARYAENGRGIPGLDWWDAFIGLVPGSMGETSVLCVLIGALVLIVTKVGSWRTMVGIAVGTLVLSLLLNAIGSDSNPMFGLPFLQHVVLGGWAFGAVFMATDPVSSAFTDTGKWFYGVGIGAMVVLVRAVNPAYPEGMMLAILFMNMFAPLIDHFVVQANIRRREARYGA